MASKEQTSGGGETPKRPKQNSQGKTPKAEATESKSTAKPRAPKAEGTAAKSTAKPKSVQQKSVRIEEEQLSEKSSRAEEARPRARASASGASHGTAAAQPLTPNKMMVVAALVLVAFFASYNFAASKATAQAGGAGGGNLLAGGAPGAAAGGGCGMSGGGGGGGCCGGGGGAPVEGATSVEGSVQKIAVDTSAGSFNPNVIKAKAGVPIEMEFSQAPGGCLSGVLFPDFGIQEDLTGGPQTVKLPALEKGEYTFYCQMQMISAKLVVE